MYFDELKRAMEWLADQEDTVFLGQAVAEAVQIDSEEDGDGGLREGAQEPCRDHKPCVTRYPPQTA